MASYNPPTEYNPIFNTSDFITETIGLTQSQTDLLYLSKVNSGTSTSPSTTFNGTVSVGGNLTSSSIKSGTIAGANALFDNMTTNGVLTIGGTTSTNSIRGNTSFTQDVNVTGQTLGCREIRFNDYSGAAVNQQQVYLSGTIFDFVALFNNNTYNFYCKNAGGTNQIAAIAIQHAGIAINNILTLVSRLNFNVTSYIFPFSSSQSLGYYLKATGSSQPLTTNVSTTILTTSTIPIGVWRIDFSVQLNATATGSHTITQSQSYLSTISNGAIATAIPFTGSTLRSHTSETYAQNDIQIITSNITYQQTTAGVLYLNVLRTFTTGTFNAIGEVSITRIA